MAPSGEAYNVDWIVSNTSNVHVAGNRGWFTSFTPFETYCGQIYDINARTKVEGVGTVELNVKLRKKNRGGQANSRIITLRNVLYSPTYFCNVFGLLASSDYEAEFPFSHNEGKLMDKDGKRAGLIDDPVLPRLRLSGQSASTTSLDPNTMYMINARWSDDERARWDAHQTGQQSDAENIPVTPSGGDPPYSVEEKDWLKKHYGDEFHLLRDFGLSIYKEADRAEGRAIVRSFMEGEDGKVNEGGSFKQHTKMEGMEHDNADDDRDEVGEEDGDEDEYEDNKFLREVEADPMSHMADYNFSGPELDWIEEHFEYSSNFMLTYGLKPYDQEDCDEAKVVIKALMDD